MTPEMDTLRSELILDYRLEMWEAEYGIKIPDERIEILYA
jgi:hypothetical protein